MSCIPCVAEGEGASIPLEDFDRWTDSLYHVLESRDARRYFREFLSSRGLEESEGTLEFWERCEVLSRSQQHHKHNPHAGHNRSAHISNMRFLKDARDLVAFAEDKVNLDLAALRAMFEAVESGKEDKIKAVVREGMQSAAELLQDDYQLFRKHLLKQRGLVGGENCK
ncbi:uncharacterized protein LOC124353886 [Homalodisca vitripennis]|uniref:uncharacterized protein LOC124353886 n=1 Tax=Homalodisca vitripennis TaxID=197043 RepID=UPI001EECF39B|nr:uncharacterized protein LOC124353886 [Homalodisca vitripennis]XP_046659887.1 uncharacterized protein LOC124353886 [Homalodisca vitripennis]